MAFAPQETKVIGAFIEKEFGRLFEFSDNPEEYTFAPPAHGGKNMHFPHRVWVTTPKDRIDSGWRYAKVGKTVAHVIVDEDENGQAVIQKWDIKGHRLYV